jgi:leucyl aminopeptidase (aminopeptidase T)
MASSTPLDRLYRQVAKKVLQETVHVQKGETLTVEAWNNGLPFARHLVAEARAMGCSAAVLFEDEGAYVEGVRRAPKDTLGVMGRHEFGLLSGTDAYVFIPGQALGAYSRTLKPDELADSTRYNSGWYEAAEKARLRGARMTFGYVGKDLARMLGKSVDAVVLGQLKGCLTDSGEIGDAASKMVPNLGDGIPASLRSGETELAVTLKGDLSIEDGVVDASDLESGNNVAYMPCGLVTKTVDPTSASGTLKMSPSLTKYGMAEEATLTFSGGVLTSWEGKGKKKLDELLKGTPPEKRRITLLNVGLNPLMRFGFARDPFVRGAISVGGFGFTAIVRKGSLSAGGTELVSNGTLK